MDGRFPEGPVTLLVTDVVGSTTLRTTLGDDDAHAILRQAESLVRAELEAHDGHEVKALGDGHLVWFASARKALACATAIQRALAGSELQMRMGVHTGEVTQEADGDLYGEAVNAAARVASRAEGGEILVSEVVRQITGTLAGASYVDRGRVRLKGFPDRWRLYAVDWSEDALPVLRRGLMPRAEATRLPLLGRDDELDRILRVIDAAVQGNGGVVLVEGEAGIGKSRLVAEAVARADALGCRVLIGAAAELDRTRPFRALSDALGLVRGSDDPRRRAIAELLAADDDGGGANIRYQALDACVALVEELTLDAPVMLVLEDAHWADPSTILALVALANRAAPLPLAVVVTMRPLPRPPELGRVIDGLLRDEAVHLRLDPLSPGAVTELVTAVVEAPPGPGLRHQVSGAAGNPLFVIELIRSLEADGSLAVVDELAEVNETGTPPQLRETILRRLGYLTVETVEVLRLATVLGTSFTVTDLALVAQRTAVSLVPLLQEGLDSGLLAEQQDGLVFRHDLLRDALYEDMPLPVRRGLHLEVGRILAGAGADPTRVAPHFAIAADVGDELAVEWLHRAARHAAQQDVTTGIELYERGLALAHTLPIRDEIAAELASAYAWADRDADALLLVDELLAGRDAAAFGGRHALSLAEAMAVGKHADRAHGIVVAALEAPNLDPRDRARLLALRSVTEPVGVPRQSAEALDAARESGSHIALATALVASTWEPEVLGATDEVVAIAEEALAAIRRSVTAGEDRARMIQVWIVSTIASLFTHLGEFDRAEALLREGARQAERVGVMRFLVDDHASLALLHARRGEWDATQLEFEAACAIVRDQGLRLTDRLEVWAVSMAAWFYVLRGDAATAAWVLVDLESQGPEGAFAAAVDRAGFLAEEGRDDQALAAFERVWRERPGAWIGLVGLHMVRLATAAGRDQLALEVVERFEAEVADPAWGTSRAFTLLCRAELDRDPETAGRAVALFRELGTEPIGLARALEHHGRLLQERGSTADAVAAYEEALDWYAKLGAVRDTARIEAALRSAGVRRGARGKRGRPLTGWESLTPAEHEVVALVADGLSNPQVASRLYLSRHTVESHLRHVYAKLGIRSRVELAAAVARRAS